MKKFVHVLILCAAVVWSAGAIALAQQDSVHFVFGAGVAGTADSILNGGSRSMVGGVDLNGNGKKEVYLTSYTNNTAIMMEVTGKDTLEVTQVFPAGATGYASEPRDIQIGDLDNDGNKEIIYPLGRTSADAGRGYNVWEWSPDSGKFLGPYILLPDPTTVAFRPENFLVTDVDGDGQDEIIDLGFGFSGGGDDNIRVVSVSGTFEGGFFTPVVEYTLNTDLLPNGHDFASVTAAVADADGDGKKEIWVFGNNTIGSNTTIMNVQATGPDTYTADTSKIVILPANNSYPLKSVATADYDNDGKDEVYFDMFSEREIFVISGLTNAANFDSTNVHLIYTFPVDSTQPRSPFGMRSTGRDNSPIFIAGYYTVDELSYKGSGSVSDSASYTMTNLVAWNNTTIEDTLGAGISGGIWYSGNTPGSDLDNDNHAELLVSLQGMDLTHGPDHMPFRMYEFNGTLVDVKDVTVITPEDYTLKQNYPNPFNPSTTISFKLPVANKITMKVYDMLGRQVRTLVNGEQMAQGSHDVVWDGRDNSGAAVASGAYVCRMDFNSFSKTIKMLMLK